MARYSKETIAAKFEWEGSDAIEWFDPEEVPEEVQDLWREAWRAKSDYDDALALIYNWLDNDDEV